jgi:hypothetical protein
MVAEHFKWQLLILLLIYVYIIQHIYIRFRAPVGRLYIYVYIYIRSISEHLFRLTPQASFRSFSVPVRRRSHRFTAGVREDLLLTALEEGSGTQRWWRWLGLTPDIKHLWFDGFPIPSPEKNYTSP